MEIKQTEIEITVAQRMLKFLNRDIVVEGQFPVPVPMETPNGTVTQFVYCPMKGKLIAVYSDGFELQTDGNREGQVFLFTGIRSWQPLSSLEIAKNLKPGGGIKLS